MNSLSTNRFGLRPSNVLRKLRAGEIVNCFKLNFADARAAELAALFGYDCLWTCLEHTANDWSAVEKQILAAKSHNTDIVVRVERGSYSDLIRPLELDATGIIVPHVMSLADAKEIVWRTRFHPLGRRPIDGGNADGAYANVALADYLRAANEQRMVILQIEDPEPLPELDAIAALPGFDMLLFGPADFSHAIGAPGQFDHPEVIAARKAVAAACKKHGKFAATVGSPATAAELIALGYQFINIGADVIGLNQYCRKQLEDFGAVVQAGK
ncbi:MAG TPA: aldolase/citrate lyase family protein [Blastocatellia bacterium]|nr:aldolase/citrate lyase family protein [Blastocatellia bacterium]